MYCGRLEISCLNNVSDSTLRHRLDGIEPFPNLRKRDRGASALAVRWIVNPYSSRLRVHSELLGGHLLLHALLKSATRVDLGITYKRGRSL